MLGDCLVTGPAWVGDMVMAQPLFKRLKEHHPDRSIDVLAPAWSQPLLRRMPEVRTSFSLPIAHGQLGLGLRRRLGHRLRGCYEQAIVLPNSFKSALTTFHANIAVRTGFLGEWRWGILNDIRPLDKRRLPRTVDRFLALGEAREYSQQPASPRPEHPVPHLTTFRQQALATLKEQGIPAERGPLLVLCPGAEYGPAKRWPWTHFAALATAMIQRGWCVVLCGSPQETELGQQISALAGPLCFNLVGHTTLDEVVDILSLAACVVSNDSGLMHVAAALDRWVIALFGSSDPNHTPPLGNHAQVLTLGLSCAPCFRRRCHKKHLKCLTGITVEQVLEQIDTQDLT